MHGWRQLLPWVWLVVGFACTTEGPTRKDVAPTPPRTDSSGLCQGICDASAPSTPLLVDSVSWGDVTTYGGVGNHNPSSGGACNYGATGIWRFAAIQVNQLPNDLRGQWEGGHVCGQCVRVEARTATGWKSTVVRIVDKCPDGFCGIDLGGGPASDLMGSQAGRYSGRWSFVTCPQLEGLSDGPAVLHVKNGSSAWWSLVQVRNPLTAVASIVVRDGGSLTNSVELPWATEAENFFKVPSEILTDSANLVVDVNYVDGTRQGALLPGWVFTRPDTDVVLGDPRR